jgi:hypothetical protein
VKQYIVGLTETRVKKRPYRFLTSLAILFMNGCFFYVCIRQKNIKITNNVVVVIITVAIVELGIGCKMYISV